MSLEVVILGCGSSGGVPRGDGDWGACDPAEPRNRRTRCSMLARRTGPDGVTNVLIDTSPDLRIVLSGQQLAVSGRVEVPRGAITVRELPPATVKVSEDTVIVGREAEEEATPLAVKMDIDVEVGQDRLRFSGFGLTAGDRALSSEAMEVLQDLSAIAQIQDSLEESEDGETDYMEVMEYLRVAPLLLFTECAKPLPAAAKPSLH